MEEEQEKNNILDSVELNDSAESIISDETEIMSTEEKIENIEDSTKLNMDRLEQEIKNGYRIVEYKDEKFRICFPSMRDDEKLSRYKSKIAMETLKDRSIILKDEVIDNLRERGLWNDAKDKQESELREKYSNILSQYFIEKNKRNKDKSALVQLNLEKNVVSALIGNLTKTKDYFTTLAAETRIDEMVLKYKMSLCIKKDSDNTCVWNSLEDFENCTDKLFVNTVISDAIYFWAGLDQSMFDLASDD